MLHEVLSEFLQPVLPLLCELTQISVTLSICQNFHNLYCLYRVTNLT